MNETRQRLKLWDLPAMDSRIRSSDVTLSEMIFGYFLGPFLVLAMTTVISTYYLTFYRTYDDILSRASSFLVLLPLISARARRARCSLPRLRCFCCRAC